MMIILAEQEKLPEEECVTQREMCDQVLRKRSGEVKGLAFGPKPVPIHLTQTIEEINKIQYLIRTQRSRISSTTRKIGGTTKHITRATRKTDGSRNRDLQ
ncbi:hypothetical protein ACOSQ3_004577 [Xanthoceras sorbifolium]